jgi:hypothetical protein
MKKKKLPVQRPRPPALLNVSVRREVLDAAGDLLGAKIIEFIHYCFNKNGKKPVWLKIDAIHRIVPQISRSAVDKKLNKLVKAGHIVKKEGEGKHYHKVWYSPSPAMIEACGGQGIQMQPGKVYYNPRLADENVNASVVYAAIANLLKPRPGIQQGETLVLDYAKLADGSGLSIGEVRKAVKWLIEHKKFEAKNVFGNKKKVWLPPNPGIPTTDPQSDLAHELPTESFPHAPEEDPTES